jgi:predicted ATPase
MHNCLLLLGFPDQAKAAATEAATLNAHNLYSRGLAQIRMLRMCVLARDVRTAAELGPGLVSLSQEQGYPHLASTAMIYTGWAMAQCGDISAGITSCERGLAQLQDIGGNCWLPLFLALMAECYEQAGDSNRSTAAVEHALQCVEESDERFWEAEVYRLKGKLLERGGDVDAAARCFATALQIAQAQRAKLLELRAMVSLAALLRHQHRGEEARTALASAYATFTEGFDFIDLREAKTLLNTLGDQQIGGAAQ